MPDIEENQRKVNDAMAALARMHMDRVQAQNVPNILRGARAKVMIMDDLEAPAPQFNKPAIFWGGSDVDPSLYNRPKSIMCGGTNRNGDEEEAARMQDCINSGKPIIGICRGAQLLNVVNGGILVQHIDNHAIRGEHPCLIQWDGEEIEVKVSSTHHQMMVAHKDGIILGKAGPTTGYHWDDVDTSYEFKYVTEVVYYPKTKSLCIQPHPEWMDQGSPFIEWINDFIAAEFNMGPLNFKEEEIRFNNGDF